MKAFLLTLSIALFSVAAIAQPPAGEAKVGDTYGAGAKAKKAVPIETLPATLANTKEEKTHVVVEAEVLDVCPKKGCWLSLKVDDKQTAFVKMKDYAFFCPTAIKGKKVVIDGDAYVETTSVEELRHYAEDAKKPQSEIDAITEPQHQIRLTANGIRVVKS